MEHLEQPFILGVYNKTNIDTVSLLEDIARNINAEVIYKHEVYKRQDIQDDGTRSIMLFELTSTGKSIVRYTNYLNPETSYVFDNGLINIKTKYIPQHTTYYNHILMFVTLSTIDDRNIVRLLSCKYMCGFREVPDNYNATLNATIDVINITLNKTKEAHSGSCTLS